MNIQLVGPFHGDDSFSIVNRHLRDALTKQGVTVNAPTVSETIVRHQFPLNEQAPEGKRWVIFQPWEYGPPPKCWIQPMNECHQVWVYSSWLRFNYAAAGIPPHKVKVIPLGVDSKTFKPGVEPVRLNTSKSFKFLFVGGTIPRKGVDVAVQAFVNEFDASDDVCLIIKDHGAATSYKGQTLEALIQHAQASGGPEILHITDEFPRDLMPGLYAACDCLVQPYRAEGFCLPVLEAMSCGLPVIVTNGGGSADYARSEVVYHVPALLGDVPNWSLPELAGTAEWLRPSLEVTQGQMRRVFENRTEARSRGARAREWVKDKWSWEFSTSTIIQELTA